MLKFIANKDAYSKSKFNKPIESVEKESLTEITTNVEYNERRDYIKGVKITPKLCNKRELLKTERAKTSEKKVRRDIWSPQVTRKTSLFYKCQSK